MKKDVAKIKAYKILSVDAADLYDYVVGNKAYYICNEDGKIDFNKFTASIYNSMETKKLKSVYEEEKRNRKVKGSFELNKYQAHAKEDYGATLAVINVTFKKKHEKTKTEIEELRKLFYEKGIRLKSDKTENTYVRYKRSAGSSREGHCLFILEPLKKKMMRWSSCGFDESKISDKVSWESYISLTLSNAQCEIHIPKESILFIPDAESSFLKDVVTLKKDADGNIVTALENTNITNKIWDGQALLDESVFAENEYLNGKGMALLRNRFFKTCAFNTKLQAWFKATGITAVSQLHPESYTRANFISDIKLVVTYSSLKSIKLMESTLPEKSRKDAKREEKAREAIDLWLNELEEDFGVVKTEKPTGFFGGKMVQTSYQLINTLELDREELTALTKPAHEYLDRIMNDPTYMRYFLHCEDDDDEDNLEFDTLRKRVNFDLLSLNDDYSKTVFYDDFRQQIRKDYLTKMKKGKLLVHGTNATLFGNGYEMLSAVTDPTFDLSAPAAIALQENEVRSSFFSDSQEILCARSPHVTMGNLFVAKNKRPENDVYSSWFNLTKEIICVNSIGECLMARLNGCDFDSDSMLITNDPILLNAAKKYYNEFGVPFGDFESKTENNEIYKIDTDISENKIGEIINTSQWLNSIFWDKNSKGVFDHELYYDICRLAVLSGFEIDKAKRNYGISAKDELKSVKKKYKKNEYKLRPSFMELVKKRKGYGEDDDENDQKPKYSDNYQTAMQLLQSVVETEATRKIYTPGKRALISFMRDLESKKLDNEYRYANEIIDWLEIQHRLLVDLRKKLPKSSQDEKQRIWEETREIESQCVAFVEKKMKTDHVMKILLERLDKDECGVTKFKSLLLSCICSASDSFYDQVSACGAGQQRYELKMAPYGEIEIFGIGHSKLLIS